jgi:hypothetical protein
MESSTPVYLMEPPVVNLLPEDKKTRRLIGAFVLRHISGQCGQFQDDMESKKPPSTRKRLAEPVESTFRAQKYYLCNKPTILTTVDHQPVKLDGSGLEMLNMSRYIRLCNSDSSEEEEIQLDIDDDVDVEEVSGSDRAGLLFEIASSEAPTNTSSTDDPLLLVSGANSIEDGELAQVEELLQDNSTL